MPKPFIESDLFTERNMRSLDNDIQLLRAEMDLVHSTANSDKNTAASANAVVVADAGDAADFRWNVTDVQTP